MADQNTVFRGPDTQEAFLADKVQMWNGVNKATVGTIIFITLLLIAMAVLL